MPRASRRPLVSGRTFDAAKAAARTADDVVDTDKRRIALAQSERQWGNNPNRNIREFLDEPAEQDNIARFLNGSFAEWVERATLCRWVRMDAGQLDAIHTPAEYCRLLYQHLVGKPQA